MADTVTNTSGTVKGPFIANNIKLKRDNDNYSASTKSVGSGEIKVNPEDNPMNVIDQEPEKLLH